VDDVREQGLHPDALRARAEQLIARSKKLAAAAEALRRDAAQFAKDVAVRHDRLSGTPWVGDDPPSVRRRTNRSSGSSRRSARS
jgi:hypothetical protein